MPEKLVICCRMKMPECKWCAHSKPHWVDHQRGSFCTEWQECQISCGELIKVRCTVVKSKE